MSRKTIILKIFLCFISATMTGCEITAVFFVEKAWDVSPGFSPSNPDMKTKASIEFKIPNPMSPKKPAVASK